MWLSNALIVVGAWTLVALAGIVVLFAEWRAAQRLRRTQRETERALSLLNKQTESAVAMTVKAGRRLRRVEKQLAWACERLASSKCASKDARTIRPSRSPGAVRMPIG